MKLEFPRQIFEKYLNVKFHENLFCGSRIFPCGRTDRHYEANSSFSQLCESALKSSYLRETSKLSDWHEYSCSKWIKYCGVQERERVEWYRYQCFWDTSCWNLQGTVVLLVVWRLKHKISPQLQNLSTEEHVTSQQTVPAALIAVVTSSDGGSASHLKNKLTHKWNRRD